jgi:hypothetical protein
MGGLQAQAASGSESQAWTPPASLTRTAVLPVSPRAAARRFAAPDACRGPALARAGGPAPARPAAMPVPVCPSESRLARPDQSKRPGAIASSLQVGPTRKARAGPPLASLSGSDSRQPRRCRGTAGPPGRLGVSRTRELESKP